MSDALALTFADEHWTVVDGWYTGPDGPAGGIDHAWCHLPDGTIVDATVDQFGGDDCVRVVLPADPRQAWYAASRT